MPRIPAEIKISNPARRFPGQLTVERVKYTGYVLDYADRVSFGERRPGPHRVEYTAYAGSEAEAKALMAARAHADGHSLGGIQGVRRV